MHVPRTFLIVATLLGLAGPTAALASFAFTVSLDTTALKPPGNAGGAPYAIDFTMIDGSGTNDANNTITLGAFTFGGGAPTGAPSLTGGATGSLSSSVTLTDSAFLNDFNQTVTAGGLLTFHVSMTTQVDATAPDSFAFSILDRSGAPIPTADPSGGDSLLTVFLDGSTPSFQAFAGDTTRSFPGGESPFAIGPPTVTVDTAQAVPEPATLAMMALGLVVLSAHRIGRLRRRPD